MEVKKNHLWIGLVVLIVLVIGFFVISNIKITGKVVAEDFVSYINSISDSEVKLIDFSKYGNTGLYIVLIEYQGQEIPVYVTKDGSYYAMTLLPIEKQEEVQPLQNSQNIPQSDKPLVELFIMSYCPYGTQAEKGILPAVEALGNSIDFKLRFVYYAMHPSSGEVEEQVNQYCIQKKYPEKLVDYLKCFLDKGDSGVCLAKVGISESDISACILETDKKFEISKNLNDQSLWLNGRYPLFNIDAALNEKYGIRGSPTLVINEVQVSPSSRSPAAYLAVICQAFSDGNVPNACNLKLSEEIYSPGFGYSISDSDTTAQCS